MRILYSFTWNDFRSGGVPRKVEQQLTAWARSGHSVKLVVFSRDPAAKNWIESHPLISHLSFSACHFYTSPANRNRCTLRAIEEALRTGVDVIYQRQDFFIPALSAIANHVPLVLEVNTNDVAEGRFNNIAKHYFNLATRHLVLGAASGLVFVTRELAASKEFRKFTAPHCVVANGISLAKIKPSMAPSNSVPRFVFIGTDNQVWHGVDKIIRLASLEPNWQFDLIGPKARKDLQLPRNVIFHGPLERFEYDAILRGADIAIGTLALHRNGMKEASPLKVREYLAYGLPTVIAYEDTDFPQSVPFLLSIPNREDNIQTSLAAIKAFTASWCGYRVPRNEIKHLDAGVKEAERLRFLQRVVETT